MELSWVQTALLTLLILLVLFLPLCVRKIEENLELFLFGCGVTAVTLSHTWSWPLMISAAEDPIKITLAVLVAGLLFRYFNKHLQKLVHTAVHSLGLSWTLFLTVLLLGLTSSLMTAIIAALVLAEVAGLLPLAREERVKLAVLACYAIGMGAVLTAIGEPLGTVVISKLKDAPHYAGFFFLIQHVGWYVLGGILVIAMLASRLKPGHPIPGNRIAHALEAEHSLRNISLRAGKVYLFVMALVLLGEGLKPLALATISHLPAEGLYWINTLSAVLDNATLAAIETTPAISDRAISFLLMSLIISGGMMIPGNIPNIICASKLGIKSKEWVKNAWALGVILLVIYFILLHIFH